MCGPLLIFVASACGTLVSAQTQTITFSGPSAGQSSTNSNYGQQCRCVPQGTCSAGSSTDIDIRIVNSGGNCSPGQQFCCAPNSGDTSGNACGVRKITPTSQPVGQASYGEYPWQVALLTTNNVYFGSGVLLSESYVLTAAHKVAPYLGGNFKVRLGEWDGQSVSEPYPYQEYSVSRVTSHPSFNAQNLQNDVAVIRLSGSVPISASPNINTACLPTVMPASQTRCWVSGWGQNAFGPAGSYQSIMKEVDVPILDQSDCEQRLRGTRLGQYFNLNRNSFLCAGGESGKDACTGDGGSPLVCQMSDGRWQVVGMVAWGIGCATAGVPGVYINVLNFLPWINQQMV